MSMEKQCDYQVEGDDGLPNLVSENNYSELRRLAMAKFATVTYSEVESSGPAASPLGFPAPHGMFICTFGIKVTSVTNYMIRI